jgi:hypothetical protein
VIRVRARDAVNMNDLRTTVRMGKGEERHLVEEFMVFRKYALDQVESKGLAEGLEL